MTNISFQKTELVHNLGLTLLVSEKKEIIDWIEKFDIPLATIFELTIYDEDPRIAFRAAWIFEEIILSNISNIIPFLPEFLDKFPKITNRSVRRHFSKILSKILEEDFKNNNISRNAYLNEFKNTIKHYNFDSIIEFLFDSIIDNKEKVGVKVWCLEALTYLSVRYPWIVDELEPQIEFLSKTCSAAISARSRKIKTLLNKEY